MKNISFRQHRAIDLGIPAAVLFVFETLTVMAGKWFPMESYTLSPTTLMLCIVMMRWDGFAALHAVVGGFAFCLAAGAEPDQFVVYCAGNCFALLGLILLTRSAFFLWAIYGSIPCKTPRSLCPQLRARRFRR